MRFPMVEHSSKQFGYDSTEKTFTAEASDLDNRHLEQIYDDSCDVGLKIKSEKTGVVITYYMERPHYTFGTERELSHWTYLPCSEDVRKHPECADTKVIIFND